MQKIIGYGEDALTYWALTEQIESVLIKLNDKSHQADCLLFFRPSFGRKGGPYASFGEFDAILATSQSVYLIESKWDSSPKNGTIELETNQILRHKIFSWYFEKWNKERFKKWQSFIEKYEKEFQKEFNGKDMPSAENKLSENIEYVFNRLQGYGKNVFNIILYFDSKASPPSIIPHGFQLVVLNHPNNGSYFEMHCRLEEKR